MPDPTGLFASPVLVPDRCPTWPFGKDNSSASRFDLCRLEARESSPDACQGFSGISGVFGVGLILPGLSRVILRRRCIRRIREVFRGGFAEY